MDRDAELELGTDAVDVSIIVVAWNVRQLLYNCLKSVFEETHGIRFEVIYVDNASKDGSVGMVTEEFPKVKIIANDENLGFIKANNQAIRRSQARYVLLLNSDTVILDNAIAKTIAFADAHPEAAVVGCKILNPDRTVQRDCFMYPSLLNLFLSAIYADTIFARNKFFGRERMRWWDFNDVREVETVCGCFSLVRKEAIEQVGVMDEVYYVYGDDPDWCYRFKKNGWKILFTPEAQIIHYGGQTTSRVSDAFKLQLYGSTLIFMKLHRNKLTFPAARFLVALFFFMRVPYWVVKALLGKRNGEGAMKKVKTYLKGGFYCLTDWKRLVMNREEVEQRLG